MSESHDDDDDFLRDIDEVGKELDVKYHDELTISNDVIKSICPAPVDEQNLRALIQAVQQATSENEAHQKLLEQVESCGMVVVRLLRKLVLA